jgi:hypothetical protein
MTLVYQAFHAALLPVRLHEVPRFIGGFLDHIGHRNEKRRPKQTEHFRANLQPTLSNPEGARPATGPD